jgi:hypothetical protein
MKEMFKCKFLLSDYYPAGFTSKSSSASGRQRHFYDEVQLVLLDAEFTRDPFPNREGRRRIAQLIGVPEKSIMVWHFDLYFLKQLPEIKFLLDCISGGFRIAVVVHANLDLQSRHQLVKQVANIVDHRLTFLVNVDKVSLFG